MAAVGRIHDFQQVTLDGAGAGQVIFSAPFDQDWYVERIFFRADAGLAPDVTVYVGSVSDANGKDWSDSVNPNIADESSPIYVPGGSNLIIRAVGGTAAAIFTVSIQYAVESMDTAVAGEALAGELAASGVGVDGLLYERGFPNQVRWPRNRR